MFDPALAQVIGLLGHFAMPAISGCDYLLMEHEASGAIVEARRLIDDHLSPPSSARQKEL